MQESNRRAYEAVVYLIACTLNDVVPKPERLEGIEIGTVCSIAASHSVIALVAAALERIGKAPKRATDEKNMAIRKILLLDTEREEILALFEREGIKYIPLKGVYLKNYYPSIGLRQMSDNDILFDPSRRADVRRIMKERGYEEETYGRGNHDVYMKKPVYNYEMHVSLFPGYGQDKFHRYFHNALDKGVKEEGREYGCRMTDEDFYIYVKAHEYKHYSAGGTGLRSLSDTYVVMRAIGERLDMDYISSELEKLGISGYERATRELSARLFSPEFAENPPDSIRDILDGEAFDMYEYMCFSGTYGTAEHNVDNALREFERIEGGDVTSAKRKFIWQKLFPPMRFYEIYYPFYYKHKLLIPFFLFKRACRLIFKTPKKTMMQIGRIFGFGKDKK